jgi:hypothetical protein
MVEFLPQELIVQPSWSHELMQHYWLARHTPQLDDQQAAKG